jgi:plasmid stabilization system protein ParE
MTYRVQLAGQAEADIDRIFVWLFERSLDGASRRYEAFWEAAERLKYLDHSHEIGRGASCLREGAARFLASFRPSSTVWASMVSAGWRRCDTLAAGSSERQAAESRWRPPRCVVVAVGSRVSVPRRWLFSDCSLDAERLTTLGCNRQREDFTLTRAARSGNKATDDVLVDRVTIRRGRPLFGRHGPLGPREKGLFQPDQFQLGHRLWPWPSDPVCQRDQLLA